MAKSKADKKSKIFSFSKEKRKLNSSQKLFIGSTLIVISFVFLISFTSYFFTGNSDQSTLIQFTNKDVSPENWMSKVGAFLADLFLHKGFGISSYIICFLTFISGLFVLLDTNKSKLIKHWFWGILIMIWISLLFGLINLETGRFSGIVGFETNLFLKRHKGNIGTSFLLLLSAIFYLTFRLKIGIDSFKNLLFFKNEKTDEDFITNLKDIESKQSTDVKENNIEDSTLLTSENNNDQELQVLDKNTVDENIEESSTDEIEIEIKETFEEESETDNLSKKLVKDFGLFDPKLELSSYKFPNLDILKKYDSEGITINKEELEENKTKIVNTLNNYKIGIESIKATIGPTVTLYEIVPEAGVRISKIKNLEDDIALSLSALGIRIIAPIPGKGTIGIEVPNKNATIVSMHSVISSKNSKSPI